MTFDDELRSRFTGNSVSVDDLDAGAQAVGAAATRRSMLRRVGGVGALAVVLFVGLLAIANLGDEQASDLRTADPDVSENPVPVPTTNPSEPSTSAPSSTVPGTAVQGTGIATVDEAGVVRINGQIVEPDIAGRPGVDPEDITVRAVDGSSGTLIYETDAGVFKDGVLWHKANDARVHDVAGQGPRALIGWEIPEGNNPSGQVLGSTELPILPLPADAASYGPDEQLLASVDVEGCSRHSVVDRFGTLVDDHPVNMLSRCIAGEIAEWSSAGHVVLVAPTDEDAWTITVLSADGESAQLTSPGAFQPRQLDVHTDRAGRTQALVLGTGEELVYIDVDAFLSESPPEIAVRGISNPQKLVSARFVDGFEQHPYQAQVDELIAGHVTIPDSTTEPFSLVWAVTDVATNDTLNARSGPSTDFEIVFEFGPDAKGIVRTGDDATSADGGEWFQVFAPTSGTGVDTGWVNSAFLIETPVVDSRPCLFNGPQDHYIGIDWTNPDGSATSEAAVISNIETNRFGGCIRTVIEFSDGWSYEDGGASRVSALPTDIVVARDNPPTIDFGSSITGAEVADARFAEPFGLSQSMFVSMGDDRQLEGLIYGPTTTMTATFDNTNGTMIIDIADIRLPADADPALLERVGAKKISFIDEAGLVLMDASSSPDQREWTFAGLARPFEANLGVRVRSTSGAPIDVDWIGGVVEGKRPENGVSTTTWTEAWGQFEFTIVLPDGVDPRDILLEFDPSGGAVDDPETVVFSVADIAR